MHYAYQDNYNEERFKYKRQKEIYFKKLRLANDYEYESEEEEEK